MDGNVTLLATFTDSLTSQLKSSLDMEGLTDPDPTGDSQMVTHMWTNSPSGTKRQKKMENSKVMFFR